MDNDLEWGKVLLRRYSADTVGPVVYGKLFVLAELATMTVQLQSEKMFDELLRILVAASQVGVEHDRVHDEW